MKINCKYVFIFIILMLFSITSVSAKEIKAGTYKIVSASDSSKLLVEKNGNIELGNNNSTGTILWDVYSDSNGFYIKSHNDNNYVLDVKSGKGASGQNIHLYKSNGTNAQRWKLNCADNTYYYIKSALGEYNIDIKSGSKALGANIQLYKPNGTNAQKWKLVKQDVGATTLGNKTLDDGTYIIKSTLNTSNSIDIKSGSTADRANIQSYTNNFTWAQVWKLKYENGFYTITSYLNNNKSLDVKSGNIGNYSNIHLYQANGSNAQKFVIKDNGNSTYSINSYNGLFTLDISGGSTKAGANIQMYQQNGSNAQNYTFEKVNIDPINTGYYKINSKLADGKVIGLSNAAVFNSKNVELRTFADNNHLKWYIKKISGDIYTISNVDFTNYVMDVKSGSTANNANVQLYKSNGSNAQKWCIRKYDDGTYKIIGVGSGKVLDISGGKTADGSNAQIYDSNASNAQKYTFTSVQTSPYVRAYDNAKYVIKSNVNTDYAIDLKSSSKSNGATVHIYKSNSAKAQIWKLEYVSDGAYIIRSMINPRLAITADGNKVVSSKYTGSAYQKWYFDKSGSTTTIINVGNGKYLNMSSSSPANYTGLSFGTSASNKDKFTLTKYTNTIRYTGVDLSHHNENDKPAINWSTLSKNVDFVVIRAGYSDKNIQSNGVDKYQDTRFLNSVENCEKYNIPYSLYFYSYANKVDNSDISYNKGYGNSAESEADHMDYLVQKIKDKGYSPSMKTAIFYDQEETDQIYNKVRNHYGESDSNHPKTKTMLTNIINRFCSRMNKKGYTCGVYASSSWLTGKTNVSNIKHAVWVAQWPEKNYTQIYHTFAAANSASTTYNASAYKIWQFSSTGSVNGISGNVDLNFGYNIFES